jgi:hypothetical protein
MVVDGGDAADEELGKKLLVLVHAHVVARVCPSGAGAKPLAPVRTVPPIDLLLGARVHGRRAGNGSRTSFTDSSIATRVRPASRAG